MVAARISGNLLWNFKMVDYFDFHSILNKALNSNTKTHFITYDSTPFSFSDICWRSSSSNPSAISLKSTAVKYGPWSAAFKQC